MEYHNNSNIYSSSQLVKDSIGVVNRRCRDMQPLDQNRCIKGIKSTVVDRTMGSRLVIK